MKDSSKEMKNQASKITNGSPIKLCSKNGLTVKEITDSADLISSGGLFQSLGALTAKALSPSLFSRWLRVCTAVYGTNKSEVWQGERP